MAYSKVYIKFLLDAPFCVKRGLLYLGSAGGSNSGLANERLIVVDVDFAVRDVVGTVFLFF